VSSSRSRALLAGLVSGLLFALAFPPLEWVALLPLAPVPWLVALHGETRRLRAVLSGVLFGLAYWCASIPWIYHVVTRFGGQNGLMGVVCVFLLAAILAEWPALVALGVSFSAPAGSPWRLALFPLFWAAAEHARSYVYGGFPWNLTGFALYRHPVWLQTPRCGACTAWAFSSCPSRLSSPPESGRAAGRPSPRPRSSFS